MRDDHTLSTKAARMLGGGCRRLFPLLNKPVCLATCLTPRVYAVDSTPSQPIPKRSCSDSTTLRDIPSMQYPGPRPLPFLQRAAMMLGETNCAKYLESPGLPRGTVGRKVITNDSDDDSDSGVHVPFFLQYVRFPRSRDTNRNPCSLSFP